MTPRNCLFISIFISLAGALASPAAAQRTVIQHPDSGLIVLLTRVSSDARAVRVASQLTGRIEGYAAFLRGDSVIVVADSGYRGIALVDVDSLWVQSTAAAPVAMIAAIPCAIFGALVGSFIVGDPDSNGSPRRATVGGLLGAAVGGLGCGAVGAGIGSLFKRWPLAYAR